MPAIHLYDKLLEFPLFQGMSHAELTEVVAHTRIGFHKYPAEKTLWTVGSPCSQLAFLIKGRLQSERRLGSHPSRVTEQLAAPYVLEPDRLYGVEQHYQHTYVTLTDADILTIDKSEVQLLMETQLVFRINYVNLLATVCQRYDNRSRLPAPKDLRERLVRYFFSQCQYPAGPKTFHILMRQLAELLNTDQRDISRALNQLQTEGLLSLYRGRIVIPMLERLLMWSPSPVPDEKPAGQEK